MKLLESTHTVIEVNPNLKPQMPLKKRKGKEAVEMLINRPIESCSSYTADVTGGRIHSLIEAGYMAFAQHYPLVLSPDIIWITIAQGIARHINLNPEKYRKKFVDFEGKQKIVVQRNDFLKGSPENPWEEVFSEFGKKITDYIGKEKHNIFCSPFSTTNNIAQAAMDVSLMDAMQSYFDYCVRTCCGIPTVVLEGSGEDWNSVYDRCDKARKLLPDFDWYLENTMNIVNKLGDAVRNTIDYAFFGNTYNEGGGSGGPFISGWLMQLIPYLKNYERSGKIVYSKPNPIVKDKSSGKHSFWSGVCNDSFPNSVSVVPFVWEYNGTNHKMEFVAGLVGSIWDEIFKAIKPQIAWAICDTGELADA